MLYTQLQIGDALATIDHDQVTLSWPDGTTVSGSRPGENRNAASAARKLGYATLQEMFCEHELTHAALAMWLNTPSVVMLDLRGYPTDPDIRKLEEKAVLALQAYMRASNINLLGRLTDSGDTAGDS